MRVSGEQTVLDAGEVASPMVVTRFARSRCLDGLVWVGGTEDGRWLDRSPIGGLSAMALYFTPSQRATRLAERSGHAGLSNVVRGGQGASSAARTIAQASSGVFP
jgi:hypothetical protein